VDAAFMGTAKQVAHHAAAGAGKPSSGRAAC
jgi:hypothetical protein